MLQIERCRREKTVVCEFSGRRTVAKGSHRLKGGSRENFFNNKDLITETTSERVPPKNFGVVERGDIGQGGRVVVTSCGGILDVIGVEGPVWEPDLGFQG